MARSPPPLNWFRLLPLESGLAITILIIAMAVLVAQVPTLLGKARLTEALIHLSTARMASIEHLALHGELVAPSTEISAGESTGQFQYRHSGTSIIASGVLQRGGPTFQLPFSPSINEAGQGWSVIWLCGQRQAPPGWAPAATAPSLTAGLSADQLPSVCRNPRTE